MRPTGDSANELRRPALYVVATPIGNLEDITLRAIGVLKEADLIACEDTRQTQKLLNHYGVSTRTTSYYEHNELTRAPELVEQMRQGAAVALVTDAGVPGISDPGYRLIGLAIREQVPVIPVPGAAAFLAALVASGMPTDAFRFNGFLPAKAGERRAALERIKISPQTEIFYEAPHRIIATVADIVEVLGEERPVVIARELTKLHEEFLRGRAGEVAAIVGLRQTVKGEITLLIGRSQETGAHVAGKAQASIRERINEIILQEGIDEKSALKKVAKERGISKSTAYR